MPSSDQQQNQTHEQPSSDIDMKKASDSANIAESVGNTDRINEILTEITTAEVELKEKIDTSDGREQTVEEVVMEPMQSNENIIEEMVERRRTRRPSRKQRESEDTGSKIKSKPQDQKKKKSNKKATPKIQDYTMGCDCSDPHDDSRPMLDCGKCEEWFHGECVPYTCKRCILTEEEEEAEYYKNILKTKDQEKQKLKEVLNKKIKTLHGEINGKIRSAREDRVDRVTGLLTKAKLELKISKEIQNSQKTKIVELSKTQNENRKNTMKLEKKVADLQKEKQECEEKQKEKSQITTDQKTKMLEEHDKQIKTKMSEINNLNKEIRSYIKVNQQMKTKLGAEQDKTTKHPEQSQEKNDEPSNLEQNIDKVMEMELVITDLKEKHEKQQASISSKDREITKLKKTVSEYMNRLATVVSDISQMEKEKIHLTESLDTIKIVNKALTLELEETV